MSVLPDTTAAEAPGGNQIVSVFDSDDDETPSDPADRVEKRRRRDD